MDYLTVRQTAEKRGVSLRWVQVLVKEGRIKGAIHPERDWLIPKDAEKPRNTRGDRHGRRAAIMRKSNVLKFLEKYFDPSLDLRIQSFNLLAFTGMAAGVFTALSAFSAGMSLAHISLNFLPSAVAFLLSGRKRVEKDNIAIFNS